MNGANTRGTRDDVMRLVKTVERLAAEDQERILRIVSLLTLVPPAVQRKTHQMLKDLLDTAPDTMDECVTGVDEVIEYLEDNLLASNDRMGRADHAEFFGFQTVSTRRN